jgi:hypothetical protein
MEDKFQDTIFGELFWEREYNWWKGMVEIQPDLSIDVYLSGEPAIHNIEQFQKVFEIYRRGEENARLCASKHLLEVHNESWLEEDEAEITQAEFCRRIQPENITIYDDQTAEIFYRDDNLFWGHVIIVSMDEKGTFTDADIAG